jgi:hypothetical protein
MSTAMASPPKRSGKKKLTSKAQDKQRQGRAAEEFLDGKGFSSCLSQTK